MATIWEKIPWLKTPDSSGAVMPFPFCLTFESSAVSGSIFTFQKVAQSALEMDAGDLVVLDGLRIAANVDQLAFSRALVSPFELNLFRGDGKEQVNLKPWKFASFDQGENFAAVWQPNTLGSNGKDQALFTLEGQLKQIAELINETTVKIFITGNIYIIDQNKV